MTESLRPATAALHADHGLEHAPDVAPPLHLSTTYDADNAQGLVYSRAQHVTRQRLEAVLGALEGGAAVTYASGQAATLAALLHYAPRRVAIARGGYHGTHAVVDGLRAFGVAKIALDEALAPGDLVWVESPRNPTCELQDIAAHAERARRAGAHLVVDSTFATPLLQQPLALGAHAVMHSMTKFIAGHSDALGGLLCVASAEEADRLRVERANAGSVPGALETWLALRGVRTLAVRLRQEQETATRLAAWLEPRVSRTWHLSLPSHPSHALMQRQMRGPGAILSIELATEEAARALPRHLHLFRDATSLGGVESLVEWRRKQDPEASPTLLRFSIGLEDAEDLQADLAQALAQVGAR